MVVKKGLGNHFYKFETWLFNLLGLMLGNYSPVSFLICKIKIIILLISYD